MKEQKIISEYRLYPTSIFELTLPGYKTFNYKFEEFIYKEYKKQPKGLDASNYGGWHSNYFELDHPIISEFFHKIDPIFDTLMKKYLNWNVYDYFMGIKGIWAIINKKGDYNVDHRHGDALLSFAYYVKVPKEKPNVKKTKNQVDRGTGNIYFKDPRVASIARRPPMVRPWENHPNFNPERAENATHGNQSENFEPIEGKLIIFPGWLEHGVHPHYSDEDRIVISGNVNLYPKKSNSPDGSLYQPHYTTH